MPCDQRFTPTPVGNTRPQTADAPPQPVHPHACGEYCTQTVAR